MAGGVAGGVVAGGVAGAAGGYAYRASRPQPAPAGEALTSGTLPAVPFHGQYQAGILPQAQRATAVVSFDATAESRS
jgi:deferrochelatase/peroxidase EfeB